MSLDRDAEFLDEKAVIEHIDQVRPPLLFVHVSGGRETLGIHGAHERRY